MGPDAVEMSGLETVTHNGSGSEISLTFHPSGPSIWRVVGVEEVHA
jgi:hypothetical protein